MCSLQGGQVKGREVIMLGAMSELEITKGEALSLLRKWMDEKRFIHAAMLAARGGVLAKIVARLDQVDDLTIRLSMAKTSIPFGEHTFLTFELTDAQFVFDAAANVPEPLRTEIEGFDSLLYIYMPSRGVNIGLAASPPFEFADAHGCGH